MAGGLLRCLVISLIRLADSGTDYPSAAMESGTWSLLMPMMLLLAASAPLEACSCVFTHLQASFCHSHAVIKGVFLKVSERTSPLNPSDTIKGYDIKIEQVLKGEGVPQNVVFLSIMSGTSCEYYHNPQNFNIDYLIPAYNRGSGYLSVNSCSFIQRWSHLTPKQIKGLYGAYKEGCNCKIYPCFSQPCESSMANQCTLEVFDDANSQNKQENQLCVPNKKGICRWATIF